MQIIASALILGSLILLAIAVVVVQQNEGQGTITLAEGGLPIVSLMALAMLVIEAPIAFLLPRLMARNAITQRAKQSPGTFVTAAENQRGGPTSDASFLLGLYQTTMIITMALFQGSSFFGSIAYILEAGPIALGVSAVATLLLLSRFPTESRVQTWLAEQRRNLDQLRARKRMGG
jgi:hypothetical protein